METKSVKIDTKLANKGTKIGLILSIIGLVGAIYSFSSDPHHFYFSYLMSFIFFLTLSLGALLSLTSCVGTPYGLLLPA